MNRKSLLSVIIMMNFFFSSCSQNSVETRQKETMLKIIDGIRNNDTTVLYKLVNTKLYKEQFDYDVKFLNKEIPNAKSPIRKNDFEIIDGLLQDDMNYRVRVYIENPRIDYVDLIFRFNKDVPDYVHSFEKIIHEIKEDSIRIPITSPAN